MAKQTINNNSVQPNGLPDTGNSTEMGDSWNEMVSKANANFTELYTLFGSVTANELAVLSGVTPGTVASSKALVVDSNKALAGLGDLTFGDGKNIIVDTTTGTKIGTSVSQKLGLYNATPIVQPAATAQSSGASTTITSVGSTSLTALDVTRINASFARIEEVRVLSDAMRTALVNLGAMKGSN